MGIEFPLKQLWEEQKVRGEASGLPWSRSDLVRAEAAEREGPPQRGDCLSS